MNEQDIEGARAVVLYLCVKGLNWYRDGTVPKAWRITYEAIGDRFRFYPKEEDVIGVLLQGKEVNGVVGGDTRDRYILLAPPGRHPIVCLLGARWRLSAQTMEMSLFLHLFGPSNERGVPAWHRGYRLELPHRRGSHNYTHVQPVKADGWQKRVAIPFADQNVPDSFPAFPLRGTNLTTLCSALAVSLYATDQFQLLQVLRGRRAQLNQVRTLLM